MNQLLEVFFHIGKTETVHCSLRKFLNRIGRKQEKKDNVGSLFTQ